MFNLGNLQETLGNLAQEYLGGAEGAASAAPLKDLLTDSFLSQHTSLSSVVELLKLVGIDDIQDIKNISPEKINTLVKSFSNFDGWQSMLAEAGKVWAAKKLGLNA